MYNDDSEEPIFRKYRCHMRSVSGMWEQYDGYVDVFAPAEGEVFQRAVRQLAKNSFPDRPSMSSWELVSINLL